MQTLTEFRQNWDHSILKQSADIAARFEAGQNLSRFLDLEAKLRDAVDEAVLSYSETLQIPTEKITSAEVGYLFHQRLLQAMEFAQFLDHAGFGAARNAACNWIEFLAIESWHDLTVHRWRCEFRDFYSKG